MTNEQAAYELRGILKHAALQRHIDALTLAIKALTTTDWVSIPRTVDLDTYDTDPFADWIVSHSSSTEYDKLIRVADAVAAGTDPDHD